jgi:AbrB family looped-hinge helix DNA binding protein
MAVRLATTKMSTKGQVVIPEIVRREMGLRPGDEFLVFAHGDTVMFKLIRPVPDGEVRRNVERLQRAARAAGLERRRATVAGRPPKEVS